MTIVCGIDAHDKELVCRIWRSDRIEETKRAKNTDAGRQGLRGSLARLRKDLGGGSLLFRDSPRVDGVLHIPDQKLHAEFPGEAVAKGESLGEIVSVLI